MHWSQRDSDRLSCFYATYGLWSVHLSVKNEASCDLPAPVSRNSATVQPSSFALTFNEHISVVLLAKLLQSLHKNVSSIR